MTRLGLDCLRVPLNYNRRKDFKEEILSETNKPKLKKKKYKKPTLKSEKVMAFGALCNGMAVGGRKTTAGAPDFCNSMKLLS